MTEQPEALRLADVLEAEGDSWWDEQAAAELRRLHEENERLKRNEFAWETKLAVRGYGIQIDDLTAANQELMESLRWISHRCPVVLMNEPLHAIHKEMAHDAGACARAAITKHGDAA